MSQIDCLNTKLVYVNIGLPSVSWLLVSLSLSLSLFLCLCLCLSISISFFLSLSLFLPHSNNFEKTATLE